MGPRRGRVAGICALAALALTAGGCGAEEHANDPRPEPPTRVSVAVTDDEITVTPSHIAMEADPTQQIPQNAHAGQPEVRSKAPLDVILVTANLTDTDSRLIVQGPNKRATSRRLIGHGAVSLQAALPTGTYTVTAKDIPAAAPGRLTVGPYRSSSENDVLLP